MTDYILYHQVAEGVDCPDGIAAAWVMYRYLTSTTKIIRQYPAIIGCLYQQPPSIRPLPGDRVWIVDFSYPPEVIQAWLDCDISVIIIDHHKTALDNLKHFSSAIFDMNECGATLAWKTYFKSQTPDFLKYVCSRDLWLDCDLFADPLSQTLIVHEMMGIMKRKAKHPFDVFYRLESIPECSFSNLREYQDAEADLLTKRVRVKDLAITQEQQIGGYTVPVVTLTNKSDYRLVSDLGTYLYKYVFPDAPFVGIHLAEQGAMSLRSNGKIDVSEVARQLGGGGHRGAAGYKL